jgi:uncharacterized oxidoreductase
MGTDNTGCNIMDLTGKTILLTGATSGIGRALVDRLQGRAGNLILLARSPGRLAALRDEYPALHIHPCELTDRGQVERTVEAVLTDHPRIDVLINNAAVQFTPAFTSDKFEFDGIEREIATNLTAPLWLTALMLPSALRGDSPFLIVNVSSALALYPKRSSAVYCATKAALHSVSQSLRYQMEGLPIQISEVILPLVDTAMTDGRGTGKISPDRAAREILSGIASGQEEIYVGKARLLPWLMRIAPGVVKTMLKRS